MKKFVIQLFTFFLLLVVISYILYYVLNRYEVNYYKYKSKIRWSQSISHRHYHYCFLGSSRIANSINHKKFNQTLHTSSINIATQGSAYAENFAVLYQFLKHNTIDTLVLGFDLFGKVEAATLENKNYTALHFKHFDFFNSMNDLVIDSVYQDYTQPLYKMYLWKYLPMSRYIEYNQYFKIDSMIQYLFDQQSKTPFDTMNGEQLLLDKNFKGDEYAIPQNISLAYYQQKYLYKILNLCKQKNIRIRLITPPYYSIKQFNSNIHQRYLSQLKKSFDFTYLSFAIGKDWNNKSYFKDGIHVNHLGANEFTQQLTDSIKKSFTPIR
jgi:hypothetical protein